MEMSGACGGGKGGGGLTTLEGKGEGARVDSVWKSTQENWGVFML